MIDNCFERKNTPIQSFISEEGGISSSSSSVEDTVFSDLSQNQSDLILGAPQIPGLFYNYGPICPFVYYQYNGDYANYPIESSQHYQKENNSNSKFSSHDYNSSRNPILSNEDIEIENKSVYDSQFLNNTSNSQLLDEFKEYTFDGYDYRLTSSDYKPYASTETPRELDINDYTNNSIHNEKISTLETESTYNRSHVKKNGYVKKNLPYKHKKRCSNCLTRQSPSWRRSVSDFTKGALLCNACGLYEKTARRKRMLVTQDDGATKVVRKRDVRDYCCSKCGVKDATRWRRLLNSVLCNKCNRTKK